MTEISESHFHTGFHIQPENSSSALRWNGLRHICRKSRSCCKTAKALARHTGFISHAILKQSRFAPMSRTLKSASGSRQRMPSSVAVVQDAAASASLKALRKEAETLLPQRLRTLSDQTGLGYASVSVRQLKSRWGSCDNHKEITLSIFLMQLPWHLIDYVLVHELTHTKVMRHGAPFWEELERHLPGAKQLRKEMAAYQPILTPGRLVVA